MDIPDQAAIRRSVINASRSKVASMSMPTPWPPHRADDRDFLGWIDPKAPRRAYVALPAGRDLGPGTVDELVTVELRLPSSPGGRTRKTMCDLCLSSDAPSGAALLVAPRAGTRGRAGDSVGLCMCLDFDCSLRVREPLKEHQVSVSGRPDERVPELVGRLTDFVERVRS